MKKIAALIIIASCFGLAGCNEEKPTPQTKQEIKNANDKLMYIAPRELPTPPPRTKREQ